MAALAPEAYPEAVIDGVELLNQRRQGMAPIANLRNLVYLTAVDGVDNLIAALDGYVEHIAESSERLAKVGADLISDSGTVLVHAPPPRSGRPRRGTGRGRWFTVSCTEALPTGEGAEMASELASAGYQVELLDDDAASEVIGGMDLVLAGAEALGPESAINKVGTGDLAAAASRSGVPIYLVASTGKVLPPALFDDAARLQGRMGVSEVVPLAAVTGVITELGVLSPEEVSGSGQPKSRSPRVALAESARDEDRQRPVAVADLDPVDQPQGLPVGLRRHRGLRCDVEPVDARPHRHPRHGTEPSPRQELARICGIRPATTSSSISTASEAGERCKPKRERAEIGVRLVDLDEHGDAVGASVAVVHPERCGPAT